MAVELATSAKRMVTSFRSPSMELRGGEDLFGKMLRGVRMRLVVIQRLGLFGLAQIVAAFVAEHASGVAWMSTGGALRLKAVSALLTELGPFSVLEHAGYTFHRNSLSTAILWRTSLLALSCAAPVGPVFCQQWKSPAIPHSATNPGHHRQGAGATAGNFTSNTMPSVST